jgi:hypothetical protein
MTFHITPIEYAALRKLELISKALALKLPGRAGTEQGALAGVLTDVLDRYALSALDLPKKKAGGK